MIMNTNLSTAIAQFLCGVTDKLIFRWEDSYTCSLEYLSIAAGAVAEKAFTIIMISHRLFVQT